MITTMKRIACACVLLLTFGFSTHKLVKTKVNDRITVSLPSELYPMTDEDIAQRFPSVRQPLGAYTNPDRVVDFAVTISATQWPDTNLEMAKRFFKAGINNLYDRVEFKKEGIVTIHKREFIFFEFESRLNGNRAEVGNLEPILKYTYICYLVEKNRTTVFTFSCPKGLMGDWQETAQKMMESIRVK